MRSKFIYSTALFTLLAVGVTFGLSQTANAVAGQWSSSGSIIYYNDGNIGIGTNNPAYKFTVSGNSLFEANGSSPSLRVYSNVSTGSKVMRLGAFDNRGWNISSGGYGNSLYGDYSLIIEQPADYYDGCAGCGGDLVFMPWQDTIFARGEVGIGVSNPTNKLEVNGTIKAKEIKVTNSGWADYVFEDGYKLLSLSDIEQFINQNKHLPNVPSKKEVDEQGILVGDMQRIQMEKIEELTLHIIEKDKEIKSLNERLEKLESLIVK